MKVDEAKSSQASNILNSQRQDVECPFALPLVVDTENYPNDYYVHDARWLKVASFRKTQINARARAEFLRDAVNSFSAFEAMKTALKAALPTCDKVIQDDTIDGQPCGAIAVWGGSFGRHYCDEHRTEGAWLMEAASQGRAALVLADEVQGK